MVFPLLLDRGNAIDRDANEAGYTPLANARSRKSQWDILRLTRNGAITFSALALAVLAGILIGFSFSYFNHRPQFGVLLPPKSSSPIPTLSSAVPDTESLSLEALRDMVARTKGYWARDYSLHLGWNNVSNYS
jgi:hypothetical protein